VQQRCRRRRNRCAGFGDARSPRSYRRARAWFAMPLACQRASSAAFNQHNRSAIFIRELSETVRRTTDRASATCWPQSNSIT
jgi:hypothetical protein